MSTSAMADAEKAAPEITARDIRPSFWVRARPYLIVAPALLLTVGILYPFGLAVWYSFTNYTLTNPAYSFIGIQNYKLLFTDPDFINSATVTLGYALGATGVETVLGIGIALLLTRDNIIARISRVTMIFPLMIAPILGALMWKLMMQPSVGILNPILGLVGIHGIEWAADPKTALPSVILIDVWIFTPFVALIVYAGLQALPKEPFEAARVDGASAWFTFRNLTLPMLTPVIIIAVIFRFMDSLKMFDIIFAMTGGGPGNKLMTFQLQAYYHGILYMNMSYALAYMMILFVVIFVVSQVLVTYWGKAQQRAAGLA